MRSPELKKVIRTASTMGLLFLLYLQAVPVARAMETEEGFRVPRPPRIQVTFYGSSSIVRLAESIPGDQFFPMTFSAKGVNGATFEETVDMMIANPDLCKDDGAVVYSLPNSMTADRVQNIPPEERFDSLKRTKARLVEFVKTKCPWMKLVIAEAPKTNTANDRKPVTQWLRDKWNESLFAESGNGFRALKICNPKFESDGLHLTIETLWWQLVDKVRRFMYFGKSPDFCP